MRAVASNGRDMSATEIAQAVDVNHATVHRFLLTLEGEGAIARTQNGRFHLGPALADLGGRVEGDALLADTVQPHLDDIAAMFREAVHCVTRSGNEAMNIAVAVPDRALFSNQMIGKPVPLHCTAGGKVFLAAMSMNQRQSFINMSPLQKFTDHTIVEAAELNSKLNVIAQQSFAVEDEEWEDGVRSIALPLHNGKGKVIAAIALSAPVSRLGDDAIEKVREAIYARIQQIERSLFMESKTFSSRARPLGNYPHLKRAESFIFISGTSARRPDNSFEGVTEHKDGTVSLDIKKQTQYVFESISDMLESVGSSLADLVDIQAYLLDMSEYAAFNDAYARFFKPDGPARTTVGVGQLTHPHQGLMVRAVAFHPQ